MNNIAVCFSSDSAYVKHMAASMASVLKNKNEDEFIKFYIIDGGITEDDKKKLSFFTENFSCSINYVKPDMEKLKNCITFKGDYISLATYYRLLIPEMINEDRIIYLDCDIIVRKSLKSLYEQDFEDNLVIGVEDVSKDAHSKRLNIDKYINAGVLLLNNKALKEGNYVNTMFNWLSNNLDIMECHDQDIINASLKGKIKYTDKKYDAQVQHSGKNEFEKITDPYIIHFISPQKPWTLWKPINYTKWEKEYHNAIKDTPFEIYSKDYKLKSKLILPLRFLYPSGIIKDIIRQVFSIRNSDDRSHKIITILGFKIKFKKKKRINEDKKKLLCHLHLYYSNQLDYFLEKLKNINGVDYDLFVTMPKYNKEVEDKILAFKSNSKILTGENRGYDVWPFIKIIKNVDLEKYDYVLKLHTKNHDRKGKFSWRNKAVDALIKDKRRFKNNIKRLKRKDIGLIASGKYIFKAEGDQPENNDMLFNEMKRIGFELKSLKYAAGTMFLAKSEIFKFLKRDDINETMFEIGGKSHTCGTYAHVYERLFSFSCYQLNYKIYGIIDGMFFKDIYQKIFAIKNSYDRTHKVITILGLKIKFKRSKK